MKTNYSVTSSMVTTGFLLTVVLIKDCDMDPPEESSWLFYWSRFGTWTQSVWSPSEKKYNVNMLLIWVCKWWKSQTNSSNVDGSRQCLIAPFGIHFSTGRITATTWIKSSIIDDRPSYSNANERLKTTFVPRSFRSIISALISFQQSPFGAK